MAVRVDGRFFGKVSMWRRLDEDPPPATPRR
jgi:hypothetical protein